MRLENVDEVVKSLKHKNLENMVKLFGKSLIPSMRLKPVYSMDDYSRGTKIIFGAVCAELNKAFVFATAQRYIYLPKCTDAVMAAVSKKIGDASELACKKHLNTFIIQAISKGIINISIDKANRNVPTITYIVLSTLFLFIDST